MSRNQGDGIPPAWALIVLACAPIGVAVAGWIAGHTSTERIRETWEFTGAMVHGFAVVTFAAIFGISAVIVAVIVLRRMRDRPESYTWRRFPLWQGLVLVFAIGWAVAAALTTGWNPVEMVLGLGVAIASIGACLQAASRDVASSERRVRRLDARSPRSRSAARIARVAIPVGLAALAVVGVAVAQLVPVVHRGCSIIGTGQITAFGSTAYSFDTDRCGSFALDAAVLPARDVGEHFSGTGTVTITSRGFTLGSGISLFPVPVAVTIEADQPGG